MTQRPRARRQRGFTLIVGLVMLVLLTLLALSSFNLVKGDLQVVSNMQQHNEAVSAANRLVATGIVVSTRIPDTEIASVTTAIKAASAAPLLLGGVTIRDNDHADELGADAWTGSARAAIDWFDRKTSPSIWVSSARVSISSP